jgi:hypothetical protein
MDRMVKIINGGGSLMFGGKIIEKPEDVTFIQENVLDGAKLALIQASSCAEPIMWKRFSHIYYNDYYNLRVTPSFDAVCFKPKRNVYFHGFGLISHYHKSDMVYNICWAIDGEKSEVHKVEYKDAEKDPEKKWFTVNLLEKLGIKPIKCSEGTKIDVMVNCETRDMRYCPYGDKGTQRDYDSIEGQDQDFIMERSQFNEGNTEHHWG